MTAELRTSSSNFLTYTLLTFHFVSSLKWFPVIIVYKRLLLLSLLSVLCRAGLVSCTGMYHKDDVESHFIFVSHHTDISDRLQNYNYV